MRAVRDTNGTGIQQYAFDGSGENRERYIGLSFVWCLEIKRNVQENVLRCTRDKR